MKKKLAVLMGGKSGEHDVSIISAQSVLTALDKEKYIAIPILINKEGAIENRENTKNALSDNLKDLVLDDFPYEDLCFGLNKKLPFDIVFPVLHGPNGEDGTIQGWLELMDIPYVGSGVLGSSSAMDKDAMKRIFTAHGLAQLPFYSFKKWDWLKQKDKIIDEIEKQLSFPCFVKPANMGSSVGVSKAHDEKELVIGIEEALKYDVKIVVEKGIEVRELEVAILGNNDPKASVIGEIIPSKEFYDYEAKYKSNDSQLIIPAELDESDSQLIKDYAVKAFKVLDCAGLSRVDFFIDKKTSKIYINEINTMPGFTQISMYPKLWDASGIKYKDLINKLIELAIQRHEEKVR